MAPSHEFCFNDLEPAAYHVKPLGNVVDKKNTLKLFLWVPIYVSVRIQDHLESLLKGPAVQLTVLLRTKKFTKPNP